MARKKYEMDSGEMDMTPMIDIVFNLLIFFMVITDLTQKDLAELTLPLASKAAEDKADEKDLRIILNIDRQGRLLIKGQEKSLADLGRYLSLAKRQYNLKMKSEGKSGYQKEGRAGAKEDVSRLFVLLRADKDTPWQHVQWVMMIMSEEDLFKLQFATKKFIDGDYEGRYGAAEGVRAGMRKEKDLPMLGGVKLGQADNGAGG